MRLETSVKKSADHLLPIDQIGWRGCTARNSASRHAIECINTTAAATGPCYPVLPFMLSCPPPSGAIPSPMIILINLTITTWRSLRVTSFGKGHPLLDDERTRDSRCPNVQLLLQQCGYPLFQETCRPHNDASFGEELPFSLNVASGSRVQKTHFSRVAERVLTRIAFSLGQVDED